MELSFIHLKIIKTRLHSCLSDCNVTHLKQISIEGPEIDAMEFEKIMEIFKERNHRILLGLYSLGR